MKIILNPRRRECGLIFFLILVAIVLIVVATILIGLYQMCKKIPQHTPENIKPDDVNYYIEADEFLGQMRGQYEGLETTLVSYSTTAESRSLTEAQAAQFSDSDGYLRVMFSTNLADWQFVTNTLISQSQSWIHYAPTGATAGFILRQVVITNNPANP